MSARPYSRIELTAPGARPPLEYARVLVTVEEIERLHERIDAMLLAARGASGPMDDGDRAKRGQRLVAVDAIFAAHEAAGVKP